MKGVVYKSTGSWYTIKAADGIFYECKIKGKFRIEGIKSTNPIAAGDHVEFEVETKGDETIGIINKISPRTNYIIRKSVNLSKQTHIIAANVDIAFLLVTLNNPPTFTPFIDRFLVTAQAYQIKAVLLFNKIDTYNQDQTLEIKYLADLYRNIGYECIGISAKTGKNITQMLGHLSSGANECHERSSNSFVARRDCWYRSISMHTILIHTILIYTSITRTFFFGFVRTHF